MEERRKDDGRWAANRFSKLVVMTSFLLSQKPFSTAESMKKQLNLRSSAWYSFDDDTKAHVFVAREEAAPVHLHDPLVHRKQLVRKGLYKRHGYFSIIYSRLGTRDKATRAVVTSSVGISTYWLRIRTFIQDNKQAGA